MQTNAADQIEGLKFQIQAALQSRMGKASGGPSNLAVGIRTDNTIMQSGNGDGDAALHPSTSKPANAKSTNVWTKIQVHVGSKNDSRNTNETNLNGSFSADVEGC
ncbi:hypothetical protein N7493_011302 [Penicillium malachiteum]|uniref:Uncharacterized protein n=1 Tax=Penicillium malachiteum TaxID=1324776 RepID=A0AAD6MR08_9EURO|nr:hypothetical protein N7493_011302 [Penicillium malachiteum]